MLYTNKEIEKKEEVEKKKLRFLKNRNSITDNMAKISPV
jgi:hypothetical protein